MRRRSEWLAALLVPVAVIMGSQAAWRNSLPEPAGDLESQQSRLAASGGFLWTDRARSAALHQAVLWRPPTAMPSDQAPAITASLACRFKADVPGGTTPKFECTTDEGQTIKVKYAGAEPHGEVASTRLMRALGFAADDVRFVERVRCHGCPAFPFLTMKLLGFVRATTWYGGTLDYSQYSDLAWAAVERKHPGTEIETTNGRGWAWYELEAIGAPRTHVDALRLMAIFLAHWDNKSENQRLVCLDDEASGVSGRQCVKSLALVQDLGATFGPRKVDLRAWRRTRIWSDRASCLVSMENMPHGGATFPPVHISEGGRRFLAARLEALTRAEIRAIFEGARFPERDGHDVDAWLHVFEDKVREVSEGQPCPA